MGLNVLLTAEQYGTLSDELRKHYKKEGDGYQLDVDGETPSFKAMKAKLDKRDAEVKEFRENNIALKKQNAVYEHEASEAKKAATKTSDLERKQAELKGTGINSAADVRKLHERLDALEKERDAAVAERRTAKAREVLFDVAAKAGVRQEARDALALLAEKDGLTTDQDGTVVFAGPDGMPKQTADGNLSPKDWVDSLANNGGAYMFAPSAGTGGQTTGGSGAQVSNPDVRLAETAISDGSVKVME